MHRYKIKKEYKKYIRKVMIRSFYHWEVLEEDHESGTCTIRTNADLDTFVKILNRAYCESLDEKGGPLTVTDKELEQQYYISSLMELTGKTALTTIKIKDIPNICLDFAKEKQKM